MYLEILRMSQLKQLMNHAQQQLIPVVDFYNIIFRCFLHLIVFCNERGGGM